MAVTIKLSTGELDVDLELDEFRELLEVALTEQKLLQISNGGGESVVVNPEHVVYFTDKHAASTAAGAASNGGVPLPAAGPVPQRQ